jgi:nitrite reductase/ring-hydroxylating ferredoxin subunit
MTSSATDPFQTLDASITVDDNDVVPYYLGDRKLRVAIARVGGRLFAFDDLCTCNAEPCPLSGGRLEGTTLQCQCHGSRFDITTGAVVNGPATAALNLHEVQDVDHRIRIYG